MYDTAVMCYNSWKFLAYLSSGACLDGNKCMNCFRGAALIFRISPSCCHSGHASYSRLSTVLAQSAYVTI